ncbi:MAG: hypothetical protein KGP28_07190 [Bdellovibrionales bacterium]|nr:hypothetical protein [Bdellovibrionales bacterium]
MNLEISQRSDFESRLTYLGGALSSDILETRKKYIDLERFFIDATLFMNYDARVTQAFLNWLTRYGVILCPSKIRRLLQENSFDPAVLRAFLSILIENDPRPKRWDILKRKAKKGEGLLFSQLPVPKESNPHF